MPYSIEEARAEHLRTHQKIMARLDGIQDVALEAQHVVTDWKAGRDDRDGRVWIGDGHVMVHLGLAPDEVFASAEEAFCRAQDTLKGALRSTWQGEWGEVRDASNPYTAQRGAVLTAAAPGGHWYDDGALISLDVYAAVREGGACRVEKIGERKETYSEQHERVVPIYRAICPADPVVLAHGRAA